MCFCHSFCPFSYSKDFFLKNSAFRKRNARRTLQKPIPVILDLDAEETPVKGHFIILKGSVLCLFAFLCSLVTNCFDGQIVGERRKKKGLVLIMREAK